VPNSIARSDIDGDGLESLNAVDHPALPGTRPATEADTTIFPNALAWDSEISGGPFFRYPPKAGPLGSPQPQQYHAPHKGAAMRIGLRIALPVSRVTRLHTHNVPSDSHSPCLFTISPKDAHLTVYRQPKTLSAPPSVRQLLKPQIGNISRDHGNPP